MFFQMIYVLTMYEYWAYEFRRITTKYNFYTHIIFWYNECELYFIYIYQYLSWEMTFLKVIPTFRIVLFFFFIKLHFHKKVFYAFKHTWSYIHGKCRKMSTYCSFVGEMWQMNNKPFFFFLEQITTSLFNKNREAGPHAHLCCNYTTFMTPFVDEYFQFNYGTILSTCVWFLNIISITMVLLK